ncbi:MAG: PKD domain-containing protein [Gaiellaceae bacterium]
MWFAFPRAGRRWRFELVLVVVLACFVGVPAAGAGNEDVNPDRSTLDASDPDGASGGRINGLAEVPGTNQTFYAATEWGGLYRTTNGGLNWAPLNLHRPTAAWDVAVDPSNTNRVYATSFYDGRAAPLSGINVSTDAGATWTHPATANPPAAFNCAAARRNEPSAFGISVDPATNANVYVGTNCGVAISTDSGGTWTYVDPTPASTASDVWDVVVHDGGLIDVCGDDGHLRSTNGGTSWTASTGLPNGLCSLAVSPDESYVLFAVASDNVFYETDNANAANPTWAARGSPEMNRRQGRIPFVATNQRPGAAFDLWFSDVSLYRDGCTTPSPAAAGGTPRCPIGYTTAPCPGCTPAVTYATPPTGWAGPFTRTAGAHDDAGDIAFDTQGGADRCPELYSSDGGVYYNTDNGGDCHNPNWEQPNVTPHATWLFSMAGVNVAGDANENFYFGLQDDGSFFTMNLGAATPGWTNADCCDIFDFVADATRVVRTTCCVNRQATLRRSATNLSGSVAVSTQPPGTMPQFNFLDFIDQYGANNYAAVTNQGLYLTTDITANPTVWTQMGAGTTPAGGFCGVQAGVSGATISFYAQTACPAGRSGNTSQLWRFDGTTASGTWTNVTPVGQVHVWAVDPNNPGRLYMANGTGTFFSTDSGATWTSDPELDALMRGGGDFPYTNQRGPTNFTGFNGYIQPSLFAFDPENANTIVAGGRDSGVFLSVDGGTNWSLVTNPRTPGNTGLTHLPRPYFAYFDREPASQLLVYVGTEGRGVWRIRLTLPVADAGGPYSTQEGTDKVLDGSGSSDPDGGALTYQWDLDEDGVYGEAGETGVNPTFTSVGQDRVWNVCLKVTDPDGGYDVDCTTVTVTNVAPSVVDLASNGPKPENSAITVTGKITDPGWLETLTATIDWGDGTPEQTIMGGTLENVRPDATLTFSVSHTYGDDGVFTAQVCGQDDDTETCQNIALTVTNVNPTATIDQTGTVLINGIPVFITNAGNSITLKGRSTDPGSDDLTLTWDWDDGPPAPDVSTLYLNDPSINPDPDPSPTINPRDVTDEQVHAFAACLYTVTFAAADDDSGTASASVKLIVTGNATKPRSSGYWQHQYRAKPPIDFTIETLECYLEIVNFVSNVFSETRPAATIPAAWEVLKMGGGTTARDHLDRELMEALLNFANGGVKYNQLVDTNNDHTNDTPFLAVIVSAETVRNDPASTKKQLTQWRQILQQLNAGAS